MSAPGSNKSLTFPAKLIHPAKSQVVQYEDNVSARTGKLTIYAEKLGTAFGIPFTGFALVPERLKLTGPNPSTAELLVAFLSPQDEVGLERRDGVWGLYFKRNPPLVGQAGAKGMHVRLQDAPLDVRERFLHRSEEFFRAYLKLCEDRLGKMKSAVDAADQTLELLEGLRLE